MKDSNSRPLDTGTHITTSQEPLAPGDDRKVVFAKSDQSGISNVMDQACARLILENSACKLILKGN